MSLLTARVIRLRSKAMVLGSHETIETKLNVEVPNRVAHADVIDCVDTATRALNKIVKQLATDLGRARQKTEARG